MDGGVRKIEMMMFRYLILLVEQTKNNNNEKLKFINYNIMEWYLHRKVN